jgi:hypothetical protein
MVPYRRALFYEFSPFALNNYQGFGIFLGSFQKRTASDLTLLVFSYILGCARLRRLACHIDSQNQRDNDQHIGTQI